jgi:glucose dehydrogenase
MSDLRFAKLRMIALLTSVGAAAFTLSGTAQPAASTGNWNTYMRFSPLNQINVSNVSKLKPVWVHDTGKFGRSWEDQPLLVDSLLYIIEPGSSDVVALEPETGKEVWRHQAPPDEARDQRGLAYWPGDGNMKPRIVMVWGGSIHGLDMQTGKSMPDWPADGFNIMLPPIQGVVIGNDRDAGPVSGAAPKAAIGGDIAAGNGGGRRNAGNPQASKSVPVIYKNLIIVADASGFLPLPGRPADPRAYDLRTGKLVWLTRLVPAPSDPDANSWPNPDSVLGSGSWGVLSLDLETGTVYVPTDSGSPDLVGIWRPGDNKWADSTVALDAETGKFKWGFQNNRHDVWDMDTMAAPVPVTVNKGGKLVKMVVQTTKQGQVWILDANTGKPVYGYKEVPVVQSKLPGEKTAPTQPFPDGLSLAQLSIDRDHLSQLSEHSNADCKKVWDEKQLHNEGPYTPPALAGWTAMVPGSIGGIDWGGASINPDLGYAFANVANQPTMVQLTHGADGVRGAVKGNDGWRFNTGYVRFSDADGRPCIGGRQGEMVAINLATDKVAWRVPLGDLTDIYGPRAKGIGASNIGGSVATRGGVVFIAAAADDKFHAFDARTGKVLWQGKMSASSNTAPTTYMGKDGRQYVVIAAGGPGFAKDWTPSDDYVFHQTLVAFALPKPGEKTPNILAPFLKRRPQPGDNVGQRMP